MNKALTYQTRKLMTNRLQLIPQVILDYLVVRSRFLSSLHENLSSFEKHLRYHNVFAAIFYLYYLK